MPSKILCRSTTTLSSSLRLDKARRIASAALFTSRVINAHITGRGSQNDILDARGSAQLMALEFEDDASLEAISRDLFRS
jgi:hypothetical protein